MKCFYNPTKDAIGTCKSCGKGLSVGYAVDLAKGLACRNRCEDDVRDLIELVERNIRIAGISERIILKSKSSGFANAIFIIAAGLLFTVYGYQSDKNLLLAGLGTLFLTYGVFTLLNRAATSRTRSKNKTVHPEQ